ncbi:amidohydrolase [Mycolicibacterium fluoranthenivorans]|uniref:Hippurate hydrolase n=1 Tax=Mycolicibacterium fluoranthenivorans TaxID=258505 RepID=A0A1G4WXF7_9MYCO|nr:amidohydrolase [Mycolicibacterium fluoranthenivorans]SCX31772.1 hippurate hydrolase [Mycolicibacterium fluoranthenivorans]
MAIDTPLLGELADLYRELHRDPELSGQEHATAQRVVTALTGVGAEITAGVGGTGVVAVLHNGDGPVVMLRADMDALPVRENTGLPYASTKTVPDGSGGQVPVAHACGHDMHTAALVGAIRTLAATRDQWSGTVLAVFQPAEELVSGARAMLDDGLFERFPKPSVVLGQHVGPLPAGVIGFGTGAIMAGNDAAEVTLYGRGGHGSSPEHTVDPVVMAAAVVMRLQTIVAREVPSHEQAVVTVGRLHAGTKENIIPDTAELGISIRTYSPERRAAVQAAIERIVRAETAAAAAPREPDVHWTVSAPVLISDPAATEKTVGALRAHFGPDKVWPLPPLSASEDVGVFGNAIGVPTVFWFWGGVAMQTFTEAFAKGELPPTNHSPEFAPVLEPTLAAGVEALTVAARTWLAARPGTPNP